MKKNRRRETTLLFLRKGEFFKRERIFVRFAPFVCSSEREREKKKRNEEDALHPGEKRSLFRRSPSFSSS